MKQRSESGYSLVELLIAIAITSVVLLTVVTLFYMGRRNVYSGKQMTYAVSVGTRIMEDLSALSSPDLATSFNITDATALSTVTVSGLSTGSGRQTFTNSASRDTTGCTSSGSPPVWTCPDDTNGYLAAWKGLIDPTKLANAELGLVLTPRAPTNVNNPWSTATFIKIRAYIQWDEARNRRRIAFFDTTKVRRVVTGTSP